METQEPLSLETEVVGVLKSIYDPEIPVNIYDLGLIYEINIDDNANLEVKMTLTAPNCPVADILPNEVNERLRSIPGINNVNVLLVFDPPWDQYMLSEEAKLELGFL